MTTVTVGNRAARHTDRIERVYLDGDEAYDSRTTTTDRTC